jgi:hypothetical protein
MNEVRITDWVEKVTGAAPPWGGSARKRALVRARWGERRRRSGIIPCSATGCPPLAA